jgi:uncharacterized protein
LTIRGKFGVIAQILQMKKTLCYLVLLFAALSCSAKKEATYLDKDGVPKPTTYYVNDFTGHMLDGDEIDTLNARLKAYEHATTTQIVVILMPSLPDQWGSIEELAFQTGDVWKIGREDKDNGILMIILLEDRKIFIATGYGAEGALTDIQCTRIATNDMRPYFENKEYYKGISVGIDKIKLAMKGEYDKVAKIEMEEQSQRKKCIIWLIISAVVFIIIGAVSNPLVGTILNAICVVIIWYIIYGAIATPIWAAVIISSLIVLIVSAILKYGSGGEFDSYSSDYGGTGGGGSGGGFSGGGGSFGGGGGGGGW